MWWSAPVGSAGMMGAAVSVVGAPAVSSVLMGDSASWGHASRIVRTKSVVTMAAGVPAGSAQTIKCAMPPDAALCFGASQTARAGHVEMTDVAGAVGNAQTAHTAPGMAVVS